MVSRPRCRDWTPLITQQLRLRNLIQISGHNIACAPKSTVYYTLHPTPMSASCFTSAVSSTPSNAIWPEINCVDFLTSTALSICVRVWQRQNHSPADAATTTTHHDTQLFLWVVYFSGLIPISRRTDVRLHGNALVFHLHGGFFTSAACLQPVSVLEQLVYIVGHKQRSQSVVDAAAAAAAAQAHDNEEAEAQDAEAAADRATAHITGSSCCGPGNSSSSSSSTGHARSLPPPLPPDADGLKLRFIERRFFANEVRASYAVEKLQLLQRKQRQLQKQTARTQALREQICSRSAYCMRDRPAEATTTASQPAEAHQQRLLSPALRHHPHQPASAASSPLTLQRLLNQQPQQPRPEVLWRAQQVRRQLETARFRAELLRHERGEAQARGAQLQRRVAQLHDANVERESWLLASYRDLQGERERGTELRLALRRHEERVRCVDDAVRRRRLQLLGELQEVFAVQATRVQQSSSGCSVGGNNGTTVTTCTLYAINGAALPNSEAFTEHTSPSEMSVALGWAAHLTVMCAVVLDVPLRNAVLLNGSASRIRDDVRVMPDSDRELPLYCRSCPPPMVARNACFLLNQNIGQLLVWLGYTSIDCRETLYNLLQLMQSQRAHQQQRRSRRNASGCRTSTTSEHEHNCAEVMAAAPPSWMQDHIDGFMDDLRITNDDTDARPDARRTPVVAFCETSESSGGESERGGVTDEGALVSARPKRQNMMVARSTDGCGVMDGDRD